MTIMDSPARFLVRGWCTRCRREGVINRAGICPKCFVKLQEEAAEKKKIKKELPKGGPIYYAPFE